jgi:TetR/AcrR family transcriptional regulator, transcriptional repressor for nem operon
MRVSNEEKERSRERIVAAAARLIRDCGLQGASVGDIMQAAGMTHGGFYRHFADKEHLLAAAITAAFDEFARPLQHTSNPTRASDEFRARYLSPVHRLHRAKGCPAAALGPDVARAGSEVRAAFSAGVSKVADGLARGIQAGDARELALRDLATLVGAMVLARAVDDTLAREILSACHARAALRSSSR